MKLFLNDLTTMQKSCAELNGVNVIASGYDKMKYIDLDQSTAGDLGFDTWIDLDHKPTFNADSATTGLDSTKFYSIVLVPVDGTTVAHTNFHKGTPTLPAVPQASATGDLGIIWNTPTHDQQTVMECATATSGATGTITDTTKSWGVNAYANYYALNVETGASALITANTSTALTAAGLVISTGDKIQITTPKCTRRDLYAIELSNESDISGAVFIYQDTIDDNATATYEMTSYVATGETLPTAYAPPEAFATCIATDNKIFAGGGISEGRGKVGLALDLDSTFSTGAIFTETVAHGDWDYNELAGRTILNQTTSVSGLILSNTDTEIIVDTALGTVTGHVLRIDAGDTLVECKATIVGTSGELVDSSKTWVTDRWVGYRAFNSGSNWDGYITSNTAHELQTETTEATALGDTFYIYPEPMLLPATADEGHSVRDNKANWGFNTLAGKTITDDTTTSSATIISNTTTDLVISVAIGAVAGHAYTISGVLDIPTPISVSVTTDLYSGATHQQVTRYSYATAPSELFIGSFVTVASSGSAGNDITDAQVVRLADDKTWLEVINNTSVAVTDDATMTIAIDANVIYGNTDGADKTFFTDGLLGGTIAINNLQAVAIGWIDTVSQVMTASTKMTSQTGGGTFEITTDNNLAWSDYGNPYVWRTENTIQLGDSIKALIELNGLLLVFCRRTLWKIPVANMAQTPTLIASGLEFVAPNSIITTPRGIMFFDGSGFSITDGQQVQSITQYKATDLIAGVNQAMKYNIQGAYDHKNRRAEYVFAHGTDVTNNTGIYITIDSLNIYPFTRMDCNVIWESEDDYGRAVIKHGTSGRHTESLNGVIYSHDAESATDGAVSPLTSSGEIIELNNQYMIIEAMGALGIEEGDNLMYYPSATESGTIVQFIAKKIVERSTNVYDIYYSGDWYLKELTVGGTVYLGMIPFDYGVKWMDFGSPQYQHKVRQVQIDVTNFTGGLYVDHYGDLGEDRIHSSQFYVTASDTKIVVPLKKGSVYTYGFRIRGYSSTKANIMSFEVLFDTEI